MGLLRPADLAGLATAPLTYPEVGRTRDGGPLPTGYRARVIDAVVGAGAASFERAADAVFAWRPQRATGLRVRATGPASDVGTTVVLTAGSRYLGYDIPCRVVWAQTEGEQRGFGYGSLPGHPESGEEGFLVRMAPDGEVVFTTRVFARLASPLARLGGPMSWAVQDLVLSTYVRAVRAAAGDGR